LRRSPLFATAVAVVITARAVRIVFSLTLVRTAFLVFPAFEAWAIAAIPPPIGLALWAAVVAVGLIVGAGRL
jgi:hypothetical protein